MENFIVSNFGGHEHAVTPQNYIFENNRAIWMGGEVNSAAAESIISHFCYLEQVSPDDITLLINSPGGSVSDGLAILDAMRMCHCDVRTVGIGLAASMGAVLLAAGTKGKRFITPNTEVMIHQPLTNAYGISTAADIGILSRHISRTRQRLLDILAECCGKSAEDIAYDSDRDLWLSAQEAIDYGLCDALFAGLDS